MKLSFWVLIFLSGLLLGTSFAQAGDVSCQVDLLKPKIKAAIIEEEMDKPAQLTVADARLRSQQKNQQDVAESKQQQNAQIPDNEENSEKSSKKPSRLGGIFEILLPSKLRNPVK